MCWRWQCGVNMHHHDFAVIISLQTHPQRWCLPDVRLQHFGVKIFYSKHLLLTLVLLILTFSILLLYNCEDDFHLEVDTNKQQEDSRKFVVEKHFDQHNFTHADSLPISRALCMNTAAKPPSRLLSHLCLLMPALLRASCWDLVIFHNSQSTTTGSS